MKVVEIIANNAEALILAPLAGWASSQVEGNGSRISRTASGGDEALPYFSRSSSTYTGVDNAFTTDYAILDVNGDGHQDIVLMFSYYPHQDVIIPFEFLLGNGSGGFSSGTSTLFPSGAPGAVSPREVLVADFNGDGRPDVFVAGHGYDLPPFPGDQNRLLLSSSEHGFVDASDGLPQVMDFTHSAAAGDIDGDGDIDILVMNISGGTPSSGLLTQPFFLINDGVGQFTRNDDYLPESIEARNYGEKYTTCLLFDADGDGDLDLFLGTHGETATNHSLILYNDGTGDFSTAVATTLPAPQPWGPEGSSVVDAQSVDLNGDGKLDLVIDFAVDNYDGRYLQFLINDGAGGWIDETESRLPQPITDGRWLYSVEIVDFNGDGHADLFVRSGLSQPIYLNDGTGQFVSLPASFLDTSGYYGVDWTVNYRLIDVNGDSRLDIVADVGSNTQSGNHTIFVFTRQDPGPSQTGSESADALLGDSSDETLSGSGGDDVLFAAQGNDTLSGGAGADYLNGGAGDDSFVGTAAELSSDTIADFAIGDRIVITDADLATFAYSISGATLTYSGGLLTLGAEIAGRIVVSAAPEGGVQLAHVAPPLATLTLTASGQDFTIGGDVLVYGTTAAGEVIELLHGDVRLDASFNIGGDTVVLPGTAGSYTAVLAGSFVTIEGGGLIIAIPVGVAGLNVQFADSTRVLRFDTTAGQVVLGAQAVTSVEAPVAAIGAALVDPLEVGPASLGRLVLAEAGQDVDIGGNVSIFGSTAPGEVVTILEGIVVLDASFNAGGDTVVLPGNAASYTATLAGSFVTIAGGGISVSIPVGIVGLTVDFADSDRVLRFDTSAGQVMLGTQAITSGGGSVTARIAEDSAFAKAPLADDWAHTELRLEAVDSFSFV